LHSAALCVVIVYNMTRDEYETRKRRLDEQLRAGVELLESAHRQQVRALDLVWMTTAEEPLAFPLPPAEAPPRPEPQPAAAPPAPPPKPRRRGDWEFQEEVEAALARVPDVFDRNDICQTLGYNPDRATLYRALLLLTEKGLTVIEKLGGGRTSTRYRKTGRGSAQADA
jgi:hypothetical protein